MTAYEAGHPQPEVHEPLRQRGAGASRTAPWLALVGLAFAAIPVLVVDAYLYPAMVPKGLSGAGLVDLALFLTLVFLWRRRAFGAPRLSLALLLAVPCVLVAALSTLVGVDRQRGFWGTAERMDGLVFVASSWALFALVALGAREKRARVALVRWFVAGAAPTFVYALGQRAGWSWMPPGTDSFASGFGNPAFYGTYLAFVFWLGLWLAVVDHSRPWRVAARTIAGLGVVFLFLAHSRGAIVAWAVALLVLATHTAGSSTSAVARRRARLALLAWLAVVALVFAFRSSPVVQSIPGLSRLARTSGTEGVTARLRLVNARIALRAFEDRPVLGWGPNTYSYLYAHYFDPSNLSNDPHLYDKVHNAFAELVCEQGFLGFLAGAAFLGYLVSLLWQARAPGDRLLLCAVVAWLVQNAFLFDTPVTRFASMLLLGLVAARDPRGWTLPEGAVSWLRPSAAVGVVLVAAHLAILGRVFVQSREASRVAYVLPVDVRDSTATRLALQGFLKQGSFMNREVLTEICNRPPGPDEASPERTAFRRTLLLAVREDFDRRPDDYRLGVDLLRLTGASPGPAGDAFFAAYWPRVREIGPRRPEAYFLAGERAFRHGEVAEGTQQYLVAARLDSALAFPWWALGRELVLAGRAVDGRPYVERALAQGFDAHSPGGVLTLIRMYHAVGDTARAHQYVRLAAVAFPSVLDSTITP